MSKKTKSIVSVAVIVCLLITCLWFSQRLLMPKYISEIIEGRLISEYYDNAGGNDVMFIGYCESYENISPITLWEDYGITSYIRGSAQQLIWQSYYLMEETLKYEKPDVFVFNVLSMKYGEPQNEAYNRMSIDGMKPSMSKWKNVMASMTDEESAISYVFPLLRYHSRWNELSAEDVRYMFDTKKSFHQGYLMRMDVRPVTTYPSKTPLADYQLPETCYKYLDKMVKLCEDNGIKLVLMKAPSIYPVWYDEWDAQIVKYADEHGLLYINFLDKLDEAGIDVGIDHVARALIVGERDCPLDDDECSCLGLGHIHAGVHHRHDPFLGIIDLALAPEDFLKELQPSPRSQLGQEPLYLVLEQDDQDKQADVDELVHECADEAHVQYLVHHYPCHNKGKHTNKDVERARILHCAVQIVQQRSHQQDVDQVLNAEKCKN
jgi:hypothetical protein